ncbi:MAG: malate dehydrogenase [Spirochaetales bacterium]|nr:malate dehydrogenase [Spirochaetales bacterium]
MPRIGVIGSGNLGTNLGFFAAEKGISDVILYDIQDGLAKGKSLDMLEAAPIRRYKTKLTAAGSIQELYDADIVVLALGAVRKPGMTRDELRDENLPLIREMASALRHAPGIVILATEPVDILLPEFVRLSGMSPRRVLGLGGFLHSTRLRYLIGKELGVSPEDVVTQVIGRNGSDMIPLFSHTSIGGIPGTILLTAAQQKSLAQKLAKAGDEILELAQRSTSYYAPAQVAAELCEDILKNTGAIRSVSQVLDGAYGIRGVAMSLPSRITKNGIEEVYLPKLTKDEEKNFVDSAAALAKLAPEA